MSITLVQGITAHYIFRSYSNKIDNIFLVVLRFFIKVIVLAFCSNKFGYLFTFSVHFYPSDCLSCTKIQLSLLTFQCYLRSSLRLDKCEIKATFLLVDNNANFLVKSPMTSLTFQINS